MVTIFDEEKCEMICRSCGAVVREGWDLAHTDQAEPLASVGKSGDRDRDSTSAPLTFHDMGLSTSMSNSATDANGGAIDPALRPALFRLKRLNRFAVNRSRQRNLVAAFFLLNNIKQKLSLADAIVQKAAYNYRKALSLNLVKGRSINAIVVASTYAACREFNSAKTIEEIAKVIDADPLYSRRCFRLVTRKIGLNAPRVGAEMYLNKAANILHIHGKAYRTALDALRAISAHHISQGKNPKALAAAALYLASHNEKAGLLSLAAVANASDISVISLRKRITEIRDHGVL
jgi:transcription initiation factor TFIIB